MLYIIATPIGNLNDISLRALETLEKLDYLLCEDTRVTGLLLKNLEIKNQPKLISFYDEIEDQKIPEVIKLLENGAEIGLVSDAGTPIVSDPGFRLVRKCRSLGTKLTSIPGPSAVIDALVLSGLPSGRFSFLGFLPKKDGERKKILELYRSIDGAKVVYESPFRIKKLVEDVKLVYGNEHRLAICREMTKKFEEVIYGSVDEVEQILSKKQPKGEMVVIIA
jgi:16S rRNA (cytidine1402-2'-O)-methyltransferase